MVMIDLELWKNPNFPLLDILESKTNEVLEAFNNCRKLEIEIQGNDNEIKEFNKTINSLTEDRAQESYKHYSYSKEVAIYMEKLSNESETVGTILVILSSLLGEAKDRRESTNELKINYQNFLEKFNRNYVIEDEQIETKNSEPIMSILSFSIGAFAFYLYPKPNDENQSHDGKPPNDTPNDGNTQNNGNAQNNGNTQNNGNVQNNGNAQNDGNTQNNGNAQNDKNTLNNETTPNAQENWWLISMIYDFIAPNKNDNILTLNTTKEFHTDDTHNQPSENDKNTPSDKNTPNEGIAPTTQNDDKPQAWYDWYEQPMSRIYNFIAPPNDGNAPSDKNPPNGGKPPNDTSNDGNTPNNGNAPTTPNDDKPQAWYERPMSMIYNFIAPHDQSSENDKNTPSDKNPQNDGKPQNDGNAPNDKNTLNNTTSNDAKPQENENGTWYEWLISTTYDFIVPSSKLNGTDNSHNQTSGSNKNDNNENNNQLGEIPLNTTKEFHADDTHNQSSEFPLLNQTDQTNQLHVLNAFAFGILIALLTWVLLRKIKPTLYFSTINKGRKRKSQKRLEEFSRQKNDKILEIKEKLPAIITNVEILYEFWNNQVECITTNRETLKSVYENEKIKIPNKLALSIKEDWRNQSNRCEKNYVHMKHIVTLNYILTDNFISSRVTLYNHSC